ncbi:putative mitochondrial protein [Cucumis melo var. makuwa]|uniref:Putative mitochondrial protein n=1 Tax=Cucumis melo var. makuwa TaxID=1194695 RepID=A0A5D3CRL1_CUCMM|nr:putative mitochondrial protein [Cucumis melo var. makuwa]
MFEDLKKTLTQEFEITDIRLMSYYLGIEVKQSEEDIFISQERYTKEILEKFNMINSRLVTTSIETEIKLSKYEDRDDVDPSYFKNLVGSLRYLTCTRLNILFWIGGSIYGISYNYSFESGKEKASLPQSSKKQPIVTLSTCEAEYIVAASCVCHAVWLRNLLKIVGILQDDPTMIHVDNKLAIALAKNPVFHDHSKHIDTRSHFIRDCISRKEVQDEYVKTEDQIADIFTKSLKVNEFSKLRTLLGVF